MDKKLYNLMNWPAIEGVVYAECDCPYDVLRGHLCSDGFLIQTFRPDAVEVQVRIEGKKKVYDMEKVDESGFFAVLIPGKKELKYSYIIENLVGRKFEIDDAYSYEVMIKSEEVKSFNAGINYEAYKMLGSHITRVDGVNGTSFAIWQPGASRVSVIGEFNDWNGEIYQMQRVADSDIYAIFIPEITEGTKYKYEVKYRDGSMRKKSDPYGFYFAQSPDTSTVVSHISDYRWSDKIWISNRNKANSYENPMSIYELHLGTFRKPVKPSDNRQYYNYRELAAMVIDYVNSMGYTHIELLPVTEYFNEESYGYDVTGYYAPTSRYGTPKDFQYFVNEMHKAGIGVILDWVPRPFYEDDCNYNSGQARNILIASALFWAEVYHIDGIRMNTIDSILYLAPGSLNIYGGKENLGAVELIKHINSIFKKRKLSTMLIAEERSAWPRVTGNIEDDTLGFDYKWNNGWLEVLEDFMRFDPIYRKSHYSELTYCMLYNYSENFLLTIPHSAVADGRTSMLAKMPGSSIEDKISELRVAYGYMFTYPGKKLMFMGQEFGQESGWQRDKEICWKELKDIRHFQLQAYVKDLNELYKSQPALFEQDYLSDGFEWINNVAADETILTYIRRASDKTELMVVVNFTPVVRLMYRVGVSAPGKYTEIFNGDREEYGGTGNTNDTVCNSEEAEWDGRDDSIVITVPPLAISVFTYEAYTDIELAEINIKKIAAEAKLKAEEEARAALEAKHQAEEKAQEALEAKIKAEEQAKLAMDFKKQAEKAAEEALAASKRIDEETKIALWNLESQKNNNMNRNR